MRAAKAYRTLLRLYPADYRALFARQMLDSFEREAKERRCGRVAFIRFLLAELAGLISSAGAEWVAKWTTDSVVRGRALPDLRMMRPPGVSRERWFAGAYQIHREGSLADEVLETQARISLLIERMVRAIANHDFPGARRYSYEESQAREELRRLQDQLAGGDGCS